MIQQPRTLYGYTCPKCDAYNKRIEGIIRDGMVTIQCPACGFLERFKRGASA